MEKKAKLLQQMRDAIEKGYQMPEFDEEPLTMEEYKFLQEYVPEIATFVTEKAPQQVMEAGSRQEIRAQQEALRSLQQQAATGDDAIAKAQREQALGEATAREQSLRQQALSRLAQTGMLSGADRITAEQEAVSAAAGRARQESLQAAAEQQQRRSQALQQSAQLASNMRQANLAKEQTNVSIMNNFNARASQRRQQYLNNVAQTRNQAQEFNLRAKQDIANRNTALTNSMAQYEQQRRDKYEQAKVDAANQKLAMQQGISGTEYNNTTAEPAGLLEKGLSGAGQAGIQAGVNQLGNAMSAPATPAAAPPTPAATVKPSDFMDDEEQSNFNASQTRSYMS